MSKITKGSLADRMKQYQSITDTKLIPKMPIIIMLDGAHFHTFTKGLNKPFDKIISNTMKATTLQLCKEIPGCTLGYTQSDEISLLIVTPDKIKSQELFNRRLTKILSRIPSKATKIFNEEFAKAVVNYTQNIEDRKIAFHVDRMKKMDKVKSVTKDEEELFDKGLEQFYNKIDIEEKYIRTLERKMFKAEFDCKAYNMPKWDIINHFIWRQQDAIRNSIEAVAQSKYTQKEINKLNIEELKQKLLSEYNINWNTDFETHNKQGIFFYKESKEKVKINIDTNEETHFTRKVWKESETTLSYEKDFDKFIEITELSND